MKIIKFNIKYFIWTLLSFTICLVIALFCSAFPFIRGFLGDALVIIFIYSFIKSFFIIEKIKLSIVVLIFTYLIEILQYFNLVAILGLGTNKIARIIIGTTFDPMDLFAYTAGFTILLILDKQKEE